MHAHREVVPSTLVGDAASSSGDLIGKKIHQKNFFMEVRVLLNSSVNRITTWDVTSVHSDGVCHFPRSGAMVVRHEGNVHTRRHWGKQQMNGQTTTTTLPQRFRGKCFYALANPGSPNPGWAKYRNVMRETTEASQRCPWLCVGNFRSDFHRSEIISHSGTCKKKISSHQRPKYPSTMRVDLEHAIWQFSSYSHWSRLAKYIACLWWSFCCYKDPAAVGCFLEVS